MFNSILSTKGDCKEIPILLERGLNVTWFVESCKFTPEVDLVFLIDAELDDLLYRPLEEDWVVNRDLMTREDLVELFPK